MTIASRISDAHLFLSNASFEIPTRRFRGGTLLKQTNPASLCLHKKSINNRNVCREAVISKHSYSITSSGYSDQQTITITRLY